MAVLVSTLWLLVAAVAAEGGAGGMREMGGRGSSLQSTTAFIVSPPTRLSALSQKQWVTTLPPTFAIKTERVNHIEQLRCALDKVEGKSVERFTKQFDKLCKTCPTRLQARPDTVVAMFQGLRDDEKEAALAQMKDIMSGKLPEAMPPNNLMVDEQKVELLQLQPTKRKESKDKRMKIIGKIEERQEKLEKYRNLLSLLESGEAQHGEMVDEKKMSEYKMLSAQERHVEKLYLTEKIAKCERKLAEYHLDLSKMEESLAASC